MTQAIRYSNLGYVGIQVTNLPASIRFYADLVGLELVHADHHSARLRCSDKPYDLMLISGNNAGCRRVGFELPDVGALRSAYEHVAVQKLHPQWSSEAALQSLQAPAAFRFRNPDTGLELEFYANQTRSGSYSPTVANIQRLGHVVLNVRDFAAALHFWVDVLGFAVSDHVPGRVAFLRCFPNPLHHSLALLTGATDGINHFNFMVADIDDVGRAMNRMKKAGVPIVFGPGRHLPSGSIFLYFLDPDGLTTEFSFGMEEIEEHGGRLPRELEPTPEVLDMWGSVADPRFGKTGIIVSGNE